MTEFGSGFLAKLAPETVSAPEILTVEDVFAAGPNAEAVREVRDYIDEMDASVRRCRERHDDRECSVCVERGAIVEDIRRMLSPAKT